MKSTPPLSFIGEQIRMDVPNAGSGLKSSNGWIQSQKKSHGNDPWSLVTRMESGPSRAQSHECFCKFSKLLVLKASPKQIFAVGGLIPGRHEDVTAVNAERFALLGFRSFRTRNFQLWVFYPGFGDPQRDISMSHGPTTSFLETVGMVADASALPIMWLG